MIMARHLAGELRVFDRLRERVQIAAGLDTERRIDEPAQQRALECLGRFRERLQALPGVHVRAVGTSTFRRARNARDFLERAEEVLGHPVEVISGQEEARLIYLGVAHNVAPEPSRRLVVDIGGGSTEVILGEGFEVVEARSLAAGCVDHTRRFFPTGEITAPRYDQAVIAARLEIADATALFDPSGWDIALGASGTVHAVAAILRETGWSPEGITLEGLRRLRKALLAARTADALDVAGLRPDRKPVLAGGLAILEAFFESGGPERFAAAPGALREGLLYDLLGRLSHEDVRDRTIRSFMRRYHVDEAKARRVERTALRLLAQAGSWKLDDPESRQLVSWAARLHEIGLAISHTSYHKHGAFLIAHSDMAGFSNDAQLLVSTLVRAHRRKVPPRLFEDLPHLKPKQARRLATVLRLAVLLNRSRGEGPPPPVTLEADKARCVLHFPAGWLEAHPLTRTDLEDEASLIRAWGYDLVLR